MKCSECGGVVSLDRMRCEKCGHDMLAEDIALRPVSHRLIGAHLSASEMAEASKTNQMLRDRDRFKVRFRRSGVQSQSAPTSYTASMKEKLPPAVHPQIVLKSDAEIARYAELNARMRRDRWRLVFVPVALLVYLLLGLLTRR